jgi:YVTN family beta-propeller protein
LPPANKVVFSFVGEGECEMKATVRWRNIVGGFCAAAILLAAAGPMLAQTPSPALLVLEKNDNTMAMVDPASMRVVARVPAGTDPHEIVASTDGRVAYISNYGGTDSELHTISVVDLLAHKELPAIDLGALRSAHGLFFAGDKLYFTVETSKAFGRYDPAAKSVDWVLGTGQDRTHMVYVFEDLQRIVTSNVNSATISIIEHVDSPQPPGPPPGAGGGPGGPGGPPPGMPPGGPRKTWKITNVPAGKGVEGFDVSPDGKEIWAANAADGTVTIIDVASKKVTQTLPISVNRANRLKFTPDGKQVLISGLGGGPSSGGGNVEVVDAATHREIKSLDLGGGSGGILIVPDGSRAYVAVSQKNKVVVIDLKELKVIGEIPTGKNPDGLAWAQQR